MKRIFLVAMLVVSVCSVVSATTVPSDRKIRLSDSWEFLQSDLGNVWEAVRPVKKGGSESVPLWQSVTVPHCFNAFDAVDPDVNYYQGPGWYRRKLHIENPYENGRTVIEFEGAGQKTSVYVDMEFVGRHTGGYDGWFVDITDAVRGKSDVTLCVRCDNSRDTEMIPSDLSDFNVYGGLYRYVNLVYLPEKSFAGIHIDTEPDGNDRNWTVSVSAAPYGTSDGQEAVFTLYSPDGGVLESRTAELAGDAADVKFQVKRPLLWSTDNPQLYSCKCSIGGYEATERFGFRTFEFKEHGPFFLNGARVLLRGTHRHEDHAGVGAAMTEDMMRREMVMMKEMGVNFIRLAHYQQSEIILDLCDSLGFVVWEEIPWCRGGLGGDTYKEQARRMLTNMINQHYNHPGVVIWGLGNENDWPGDFPEFDKQKIREFMAELNDLSHSLDPGRKTAIRRCSFCSDIVDVYSPSIWAGWYRGVYTDYRSISEKEMNAVDRFLHVEWGGDSHAGRHSEDAFANIKDIQATGEGDERAGDASFYGGAKRASKDGDWSESYIVRLFDWHLKEQENMPWLTGAAAWIFKDFSTPVRPENPVPYVNQKGVLQRDGTPKESYYVFQSYWTDKPMAHIYGHSWPVRWGEPGERKEVLVYSNCERVELFVNGVSQGERKRNSQDFPAAGLRWKCAFEEGENTINVVGYKGKEIAVDYIVQKYQTRKWGSPASIGLSAVKLPDGTVRVDACIEDADGVQCLDCTGRVRFGLTGDGTLITDLGTPGASTLVGACNGAAGICVRQDGGHSVVSVSMEGVPTAFITLE